MRCPRRWRLVWGLEVKLCGEENERASERERGMCVYV